MVHFIYGGVTGYNFQIELYSKALMAQTLMAHSPGMATTIFMIPTGIFMHNPPWMAGTALGYNYFLWSQACLSR